MVNLSSEWILLVLEKELKSQKTVNVEPILNKLDKNKQRVVRDLYKEILFKGDDIFKQDIKLVNEICGLGVDEVMPFLIEMLNVLETGKHEACTVYAIILKIGRKDKRVLNYLKEALNSKIAPKYYLEELISKLSKFN